jgi:hypothetical protein
MIDLSQRTEPYELELPSGLKVTVKPLTTAGMAAAQAAEVLLACQGQLRLAPSGYVIGIDVNAALKIGAARGYDLAVLSELLPAAEAGGVEVVVWSDRVRGGGP